MVMKHPPYIHIQRTADRRSGGGGTRADASLDWLCRAAEWPTGPPIKAFWPKSLGRGCMVSLFFSRGAASSTAGRRGRSPARGRLRLRPAASGFGARVGGWQFGVVRARRRGVCLGWRAPLSVVMPLRARAAGRGPEAARLSVGGAPLLLAHAPFLLQRSLAEASQRTRCESAPQPGSEQSHCAVRSLSALLAHCSDAGARRCPLSRLSAGFFLPTLAPPAPPGPPSTSSVKCVTRLDEAGPAMINTM